MIITTSPTLLHISCDAMLYSQVHSQVSFIATGLVWVNEHFIRFSQTCVAIFFQLNWDFIIMKTSTGKY